MQSLFYLGTSHAFRLATEEGPRETILQWFALQPVLS
jgi:hypothetical protein